MIQPGLIVLLGSGETQPSSSKMHEYIAQKLPSRPHICILETPAGFELNSAEVAAKIRTFLERRLQNYQPKVDVIPARKRGTFYSPDERQVLEPLLTADEIILGPGSPTYCVRQLYGSLAFDLIRCRNRLGATILLSSAATIAFSKYALPVYEIYKVGEDPFWMSGLNFLADYGLNAVFVPHWNNNDGGDNLDTSHCYIGQPRFEEIRDQIPKEVPIIGIDEHTSLIINVKEGYCQVMGNDSVTVIKNGMQKVYYAREEFPVFLLGDVGIPEGGEGIKPGLWQEAAEFQLDRERSIEVEEPDDFISFLVKDREEARKQNDWQTADRIRDKLIHLGWQVRDTEEGSALYKILKE